jgi:excinuclease UvrABC nuclease subunit
MEAEMKRASKALEFERAADIRDEMQRLKRLLPDQDMLPGKRAAARSR